MAILTGLDVVMINSWMAYVNKYEKHLSLSGGSVVWNLHTSLIIDLNPQLCIIIPRGEHRCYKIGAHVGTGDAADDIHWYRGIILDVIIYRNFVIILYTIAFLLFIWHYTAIDTFLFSAYLIWNLYAIDIIICNWYYHMQLTCTYYYATEVHILISCAVTYASVQIMAIFRIA